MSLRTLMIGAVTVLFSTLSASTARADEIAIWNFNDSNLIVDRGTGTLTTTANPANITFLSGSTFNARMGDAAGNALTIQGGTGLQNNGSILELRASTVGFSDIALNWTMASTATGFNGVTVQFSNDGVNFNTTFTFTPSLSFSGSNAVTFGLPSGVNNNALFAFRWILNGATDATGNIRFDNISLEGVPAVPEPATITLLAIGSVLTLLKVRTRR